MIPPIMDVVPLEDAHRIEFERGAKWDHRFLRLASEVASWSKDTSTKVGAVIVRPDHTVASLGFNGFPRGIDDTPERLSDRDVRLALTVHAEINAILSSHVPVRGCTLYATLPCCDRCAAQIIQAGISRVISLPASPAQSARWGESFERARFMLSEAGVFTI